eukprot:926316-Prymnesium_polylepis.1
MLGWAVVSLNAKAALQPFALMRRVFRAKDTDGDGKLMANQLLDAMRELGLETTSDVIHVSRRADLRGDGS